MPYPSIIRLESFQQATTMKTFLCLFLIVLAVVVAEPPRYRNARFQFQRQEVNPEREEQEANGDRAPYPPAGYKPSREFKLPSRQEVRPSSNFYGIPANSYGAPFNTYAAPQTEYGTPRMQGRSENEYQTPEREGEDREREDETDSEQFKVEGLKERRRENNGKLHENEEKEYRGENEVEDNENVINQRGAYYVILPDAQLQRVQFQTTNDLSNMAYTARLQYRNEDRAPVYVYTSVPNYQSASYIQLF